MESGNTVYDSRDNCNALIETKSNKLLQGCNNTVIPYSVTSIGNSAFSSCSGLNSINIPNTVTSIESGAFSVCSGLTSINIPNSVTAIGSYAFSGCSGLTSINIPNSVTAIGSSAFYGCSSLTSITIPNSVTAIGGKTFSDCSSLTSIIIPNSVTAIEWAAFSGCSALTSVNIPNSVTTIGDATFHGCSSLTSITIPNSVTSIGSYVFSGCSDLTSVTIPNSVTSIEQEAFAGCSHLEDVYCYATTVPSTSKDAFNDSYFRYATLHIPASAMYDYKSKEPWSLFKEIVAIESQKYSLKYMVDGTLYKEYSMEEGTSITPEPEPTKDGYTFSGWSWIPKKMPEEDVTITGTFTPSTGVETAVVSGRPFDVYTVTGRKVRSQVTSLKGLKKGVYIVEGKKVVVK